jgi:hypothetical protein
MFGVLACVTVLTAGSWQAATAGVRQPAKTVGESTANCVQVSGMSQASDAPWTLAEMRESIPFSESALARVLARLTPAQRRAADESADTGTSAGCASTGSDALSAPELAPAVSSTSVSSPKTRNITSGYRTIGKFFYDVDGFPFNCTATAVNDPKNNAARALVLTAAHCFKGYLDNTYYASDDWQFAPGWHNNTDPYGLWQVKSAWYPDPWIKCVTGAGFEKLCSTVGQYDFALFIVKPQHGHGVGWYTGQDGWHDNMPDTESVSIFGIPGNSGTMKVNSTVSHTVTVKDTFIWGAVNKYTVRKAATPGFGDGASGGPWFYSYSFGTQIGLLLGDTGGYEYGGNSASPSYSPYWTPYFGGFVVAIAAKE